MPDASHSPYPGRAARFISQIGAHEKLSLHSRAPHAALRYNKPDFLIFDA
jgi:hypothetical protein